jgi:hypothetical protein
MDYWEELNDHPSRSKSALFGTKNFFCHLEDLDGEMLTFYGEVDWREDSEGLRITDIRYWPPNESMRESVEDFVFSLFVR